MSGKAWRDRRAEINARPDPPGYRRRRSAIPLLITLLALVVLAPLVVAGVLALALTLFNPQA